MKQVIMINGKKRSGKDYTAKLIRARLEEIGYRVDVLSFADPLKRIIAKTLNISLSELDDAKNIGAPVTINNKQVTDMRKVLQVFGTEAMKEHFGDDVWVDLLELKINRSAADFVIVPDFRFWCEECLGDIFIEVINKTNQSIDDHASENGLNNFKFDYTIDNTGYGYIQDQIEKLVEELV